MAEIGTWWAEDDRIFHRIVKDYAGEAKVATHETACGKPILPDYDAEAEIALRACTLCCAGVAEADLPKPATDLSPTDQRVVELRTIACDAVNEIADLKGWSGLRTLWWLYTMDLDLVKASHNDYYGTKEVWTCVLQHPSHRNARGDKKRIPVRMG